jgi:hypothetical protein
MYAGMEGEPPFVARVGVFHAADGSALNKVCPHEAFRRWDRSGPVVASVLLDAPTSCPQVLRVGHHSPLVCDETVKVDVLSGDADNSSGRPRLTAFLNHAQLARLPPAWHGEEGS